MGTVDRAELVAAYRDHVNAGKVAFFESLGLDAVMGGREGARFRDPWDEDRWWWDCHTNGGTFSLGHRNPGVVEAVVAALDHLDIGNHHLLSPLRGTLARRLAATTDDRLPGVVFGVSGGEAVDLALKVARAATGRRGVVSVVGGYHGHTGLAVAAGEPRYRDPFLADQPGFVRVPFDDLPAMERAVDDTVAAVLVEPVPATLGMPIPGPGYLPGVAELCRARGAKLIVDEVQTGLGRTARMWAHQHWDVQPDVLVTGKGLSGGVYPITATLMTRELHAVFDDHPFAHVSTFGGAEPGCAAALAVLEVVEAPGFLERVEALGRRFEERFAGAPFALRRLGMMMGLKLPTEGAGLMAAKALYDHGVFAAFANHDLSVVQFLPPLTLSDDEVDAIAVATRRALG